MVGKPGTIDKVTAEGGGPVLYVRSECTSGPEPHVEHWAPEDIRLRCQLVTADAIPADSELAGMLAGTISYGGGQVALDLYVIAEEAAQEIEAERELAARKAQSAKDAQRIAEAKAEKAPPLPEPEPEPEPDPPAEAEPAEEE